MTAALDLDWHRSSEWVKVSRPIQDAYRAARQARFEHGESGR